jgi:hypothetical protein
MEPRGDKSLCKISLWLDFEVSFPPAKEARAPHTKGVCKRAVTQAGGKVARKTAAWRF